MAFRWPAYQGWFGGIQFGAAVYCAVVRLPASDWIGFEPCRVGVLDLDLRCRWRLSLLGDPELEPEDRLRLDRLRDLPRADRRSIWGLGLGAIFIRRSPNSGFGFAVRNDIAGIGSFTTSFTPKPYPCLLPLFAAAALFKIMSISFNSSFSDIWISKTIGLRFGFWSSTLLTPFDPLTSSFLFMPSKSKTIGWGLAALFKTLAPSFLADTTLPSVGFSSTSSKSGWKLAKPSLQALIFFNQTCWDLE